MSCTMMQQSCKSRKDEVCDELEKAIPLACSEGPTPIVICHDSDQASIASTSAGSNFCQGSPLLCARIEDEGCVSALNDVGVAAMAINPIDLFCDDDRPKHASDCDDLQTADINHSPQYLEHFIVELLKREVKQERNIADLMSKVEDLKDERLYLQKYVNRLLHLEVAQETRRSLERVEESRNAQRLHRVATAKFLKRGAYKIQGLALAKWWNEVHSRTIHQTLQTQLATQNWPPGTEHTWCGFRLRVRSKFSAWYERTVQKRWLRAHAAKLLNRVNRSDMVRCWRRWIRLVLVNKHAMNWTTCLYPFKLSHCSLAFVFEQWRALSGRKTLCEKRLVATACARRTRSEVAVVFERWEIFADTKARHGRIVERIVLRWKRKTTCVVWNLWQTHAQAARSMEVHRLCLLLQKKRMDAAWAAWHNQCAQRKQLVVAAARALARWQHTCEWFVFVEWAAVCCAHARVRLTVQQMRKRCRRRIVSHLFCRLKENAKEEQQTRQATKKEAVLWQLRYTSRAVWGWKGHASRTRRTFAAIRKLTMRLQQAHLLAVVRKWAVYVGERRRWMRIAGVISMRRKQLEVARAFDALDQYAVVTEEASQGSLERQACSKQMAHLVHGIPDAVSCRLQMARFELPHRVGTAHPSTIPVPHANGVDRRDSFVCPIVLLVFFVLLTCAAVIGTSMYWFKPTHAKESLRSSGSRNSHVDESRVLPFFGTDVLHAWSPTSRTPRMALIQASEAPAHGANSSEASELAQWPAFHPAFWDSKPYQNSFSMACRTSSASHPGEAAIGSHTIDVGANCKRTIEDAVAVKLFNKHVDLQASPEDDAASTAVNDTDLHTCAFCASGKYVQQGTSPLVGVEPSECGECAHGMFVSFPITSNVPWSTGWHGMSGLDNSSAAHSYLAHRDDHAYLHVASQLLQRTPSTDDLTCADAAAARSVHRLYDIETEPHRQTSRVASEGMRSADDSDMMQLHMLQPPPGAVLPLGEETLTQRSLPSMAMLDKQPLWNRIRLPAAWCTLLRQVSRLFVRARGLASSHQSVLRRGIEEDFLAFTYANYLTYS